MDNMDTEKLILAADVGGTKTLMCLFDGNDGDPREIRTKKYTTCDYGHLSEILDDFLQECDGLPKAGVFGIPGPVQDGKVESTNLPWSLDERELSKKSGIPKIELLNDLAATAYAIPHLKSEEVVSIRKGTKVKNPERFIVLAPGTGLGQAFLIKNNDQVIIIPSEGGHADFAPTSETEADLYRYLLKEFGHVSFERVISGQGLPNIFDFLREVKKMNPNEETLERMKNEDKGIVISEMALGKKDNVCEKALDIFTAVLGGHAGNLALTFMADGGIYLAGGIPHKILDKIKDGTFEKNYLRKGRLKDVVEEIPVNLITNNRAAIQGAALKACEISGQVKSVLANRNFDFF